MKSIITWVQTAILNTVPNMDLSSIPAKSRGKLRLSPEQLLAIVHAHVLAEWALMMGHFISMPRLPRGPGGSPPIYYGQQHFVDGNCANNLAQILRTNSGLGGNE